MPPKRSEKKKRPPLQTSTVDDPLPKLPRTAWKNGEQLEYLLSRWDDFVTHQNEGSLDRFWPTVYNHWHKTWSIAPSIQSIEEHGSRENAILALRSKTNTKIRNWFHNHGRPSSRSAKSELRLHQNEKRKRAPAQAFCAYAWDSGLREIVTARWEKEKLTHMSADDDDPTADSIETPGSGSHIPIDFKLKIAKEVYNELSEEEKKQVDDRREDEWKKMYRLIPEITDAEEREEKLRVHQQNQPSIPKSLLRTLKNLEDQTGCVAQLLVGSMDPQTGRIDCQKFCQGKSELGLNFREFYGDNWDHLVEKCFKDWAVVVFGEKRSARRSLFMLSNGSSNPGEVAPTAGTSRAAATEELADNPPEIDEETTGEFGIAPLPQPPQLLKTPRFVAPRELLLPSRAPEPAKSVLSTVAERPLITPAVAGSSQPVSLNQAIVPPVIPEPASLVAAPILGPSHTAVTPNKTVSPVVRESPSSITPVLESSRAVPPNNTTNSATAHKSPHLVTSPVLESSPAVTSDRVAISPIVYKPPVLTDPSGVLESSQATPHRQVVVSQKSVSPSQATHPPNVIHKSRPIVVHRSPDLAGGIAGSNSGAAMITKGVYRLRGEVSATKANRVRRDSIEEAPDVVLSLGKSGYELANPPSHSENDTDVSTPLPAPPPSTTPSSTPSPDEFIVPSSQQSLEEDLTIPMEVETDSSYPDALMTPLSQQGPLTTTTTLSGQSRFAPRMIPTYNIDRSDIPSWLLERGRLDYVLSVKAGDLWKKLITTWIRQERRLAFGLNEKLGGCLSLREKPNVLKDYFKWHHSPSKGDSVRPLELGDEVWDWWAGLQPKWRYKEEEFPDVPKDYSFILAGGKKGIFLLILCLAWWDNAHGRELEGDMAERREAAKAAGATVDFGGLREHEPKWFNIVNDLIFVMELAQGWPAPGESTLGSVGVTTAPKKRVAKRGNSSSPRKKKKTS